MKKLLITLFAVLPALAQAPVDTGNGLLAGLQKCHDIHNRLIPHGDTDALTDAIMYCDLAQGYVEGAFDSLTWARANDFNIPDNITHKQIHDLVEQFIISHPALRHKGSEVLIFDAIYAVWGKR